MTKLTADIPYASCGGMLVPPEIAPDVETTKDNAYVCLTCGHPYRWMGRRLDWFQSSR